MPIRSLSVRFAALAIAACTAAPAFAADAPRSVERGRYVAQIAGCNDCHTANYAQSGGRVPEKEWLTGDRLGWRGPWGTTYPANLRIVLSRISEDDWVRLARTAQYRPPMPWFALRDMNEDDLRSFHRFVRSLGVAGDAAPAFVPPGKEPQTAAIVFPMKAH